MARIGFHAAAVWQFWHGIARFPCGLRVLVYPDCCAAAGSAAAVINISQNRARNLT